METKDIIVLSVIGLVLILNILASYLNARLYKQKCEFLEDRIDNVTKLYEPVLSILTNYYVDREDYKNAQKCVELISSIHSSDEVLKKC